MHHCTLSAKFEFICSLPIWQAIQFVYYCTPFGLLVLFSCPYVHNVPIQLPLHLLHTHPHLTTWIEYASINDGCVLYTYDHDPHHTITYCLEHMSSIELALVTHLSYFVLASLAHQCNTHDPSHNCIHTSLFNVPHHLVEL